MKIQELRSWLAFITGAVILGSLIGLGMKVSLFDAYAQNDKKNVKLARTVKPQVKFNDLKVAQKSLKLDEDFDAEADWVKSLSFKLENVSGKRIVFLTANVNFPETRLTGELMSYQISFGQRPGLEPINDNPPISFMPDETLEISLDKEKDRIYKFVNERQPIEKIQKVELEIGFIIFEDRTAWSAGSFMRQDRNNPRIYNPIEKEPQQ